MDELDARCPVCHTHLYHHGEEGERVHLRELPVMQDVITWYSRGEIPAAQIRQTYASPHTEVYHLTITRRQKP